MRALTDASFSSERDSADAFSSIMSSLTAAMAARSYSLGTLGAHPHASTTPPQLRARKEGGASVQRGGSLKIASPRQPLASCANTIAVAGGQTTAAAVAAAAASTSTRSGGDGYSFDLARPPLYQHQLHHHAKQTSAPLRRGSYENKFATSSPPPSACRTLASRANIAANEMPIRRASAAAVAARPPQIVGAYRGGGGELRAAAEAAAAAAAAAANADLVYATRVLVADTPPHHPPPPPPAALSVARASAPKRLIDPELLESNSCDF